MRWRADRTAEPRGLGSPLSPMPPLPVLLHLSAPVLAIAAPMAADSQVPQSGTSGLFGSLVHPVAGAVQAWLIPLAASLPTLALSLALLALLLLLGTGLGRLLGTHQWGIPEALLAGGLGLLVAPAGALALIPPSVIQLWDQLPLILLTLVFASLLLGKPLPALSGLWRPLSAQMLLALTLAFGQYLVAALAVLLLLQPLMGAPSVMACLIEVAYEGGHGSAAAMGPTYARLGLESGEALGLALATVGLLASTLVGGLLVLIGRSRGWVAGGALAAAPTPGAAAISASPPPSSTSGSPEAAAAVQAAPAMPPGSALAAPEATASPGESRVLASGSAPDPALAACQARSTSAMPTPIAAPGLEPGASRLGHDDSATAAALQSVASAPAPLATPSCAVIAAANPDTEAAGLEAASTAPGGGVDGVCSRGHAPDPLPTPGQLTLRSFAVNLALTGSAVLIGVLLLEALRRLAAWQGGLLAMVVEAFPVFPLALLGSLLVRLVLERTGRTDLVLPKLQGRIGTLSADLLITAATACLDLSLLARDWLPLTVLAVVGLLWNLAVILLLAPRILPASWFERGLVEFGQATGVAASGLLLLNMVDPDDRNGSLTPFSIKQLLLQPFLAGGVITVVAPLAVDGWGLPVWSAVCLALVILWSGLGLWLARGARVAGG